MTGPLLTRERLKTKITMKKVFWALAAATMMVSCFGDQTLTRSDFNKIELGSYVNNTTVRAGENPTITSESIDAFDVWAFMDEPSGVVFSKERVSKDANGVWGYTNTAYWSPSHSYFFAALAPVDNASIELVLARDPYIAPEGLGTVTFTNEDGTVDLLYAEQKVSTPSTITKMAAVNLGFQHLLSKVRFSFQNCMSNVNTKLAVRNITMTVPGKASVALTEDTYSWVLDATAEAAVLKFGSMNAGAKVLVNEWGKSDNHRLTIPAGADKEYLVSFDVDIYANEVLGHTQPMTTTIKGCELKPGKQYNFTAKLTGDNLHLDPIVFDKPSVDEWGTEVEYDGGEIETQVK